MLTGEPLQKLLAATPRAVLAKGRAYFLEGRVQIESDHAGAIHAHVRGSSLYCVDVNTAGKTPAADCSCPQFSRAGECKHIAAALYAILDKQPTQPGRPSPLRSPFVHYADEPPQAFLEVMRLYQPRAAWPKLTPPRWGNVASWFQSVRYASSAAATALQAIAQNCFPAMLETEAAIRSFDGSVSVPAVLEPMASALRTAFKALLPTVTVIAAPPQDATWTFHVDIPRQRFYGGFSASPGTVSVELETNAVRHCDHKGFALAGLRAALAVLATPAHPVHRQLVATLEIPRWSHTLDRLERTQRDEYAFVARQDHGSLTIDPLKRNSAKPDRPWSRTTYEAILQSPNATAADQEIARWANMLRRAFDAETLMAPLIERLALHPRVFANDSGAPLWVGVEDARLRFSQAGASVNAQLSWHDGELTRDMLAVLIKRRFIVVSRPDRLHLVRLPTELVGWASEFLRVSAPQLSFPADAYPRLAKSLNAATEFVDVPADVSAALLGERREYQPMPALAVEWAKRTKIALLITVAPGAPLIRAGEGDERFSYVADGRAWWVERDLARERDVVALGKLQLPLVDWGDDTGEVATLEAALALSEFVSQLPDGWRVESRLGRPPMRLAWSDVQSSLVIAQSGGWFSCRGDVQAGGSHVSLGELLEALRRAQRYIAIGDDQHLEIPDQLRKQLAPLAFAASDEAGKLRVHSAFGDAVQEAAAVFSSATDEVDWAALAQHHTGKRPNVPAIRNGKLRPYQVDGVRWMLERAACTPGCVLADDMGLGKTVQTAAVLLARRGRGPALIVAPASVTFNWQLELARFAPQLSVVLFNETRSLNVEASKRADVVIVSYGLLQRDPSLFKTRWSTLVVDEAQYLKNHIAKRTAAVRDLSRDFTIALTGTPVENHLGELWSVMSLAFPGLLGNEAAFRSRFQNGVGPSEHALAALNRLLAPFLLRRTRANVLRELPARQDIDLLIDLSQSERKRYETLRRACELQFVERDAGLTAAQERIQILAALTRLRQMACDVKLVEPTFKGESAKLEHLKTLCRELADQDAAVLVFSQFTQLLTRARDAVAALGIATHYLDGATPLAERQRLITAFQNGSGTVFFISLKAGGTGLNLTRASYVVHLDPWWNPAVEEQANSRAHRMGQKHPVTAYRLIARGTVEESMLALHDQKRDLALSVLEGKSIARTLSKADFMGLLREHAQLDAAG